MLAKANSVPMHANVSANALADRATLFFNANPLLVAREMKSCSWVFSFEG